MLHDNKKSIRNGGNGATRTSTDDTINTGKISPRVRIIALRKAFSAPEGILSPPARWLDRSKEIPNAESAARKT
jgi:hypothetical protein